MIVILDTNVVVAGLRSKEGSSFQILNSIGGGIFSFVLSVPLLLEYESVLKRNAFLEKTGFDIADIDQILNQFAAKAIRVKPFYLWRPLSSDPKDDMVLETAVAGNAEAIVTMNTRDLVEGARQFGIETLSPAQFLIRIRERMES